ncbi:MAG: restriction endonuclease subunit S [Bacteroidia bacterium]|nr:restriction endonuclease subunit S [Bacteroidia bacterium]
MNQTSISSFPQYPAYKDSGVEWLGQIPEHWEVRRFKFLFKEINEKSNDGSEELLSVSQYTGVTKKSDKVENGDLLTTASTLEGYKKVYINDLVSNIMLAWNGSLGFSPFNGITSPAYSVYRLNEGNSERFFHYLVRSEIYKSEFKRKSSGVIESRLRLYTDDFYKIWSLLPPPNEQTRIAAFLDDKTAKIDRAIAQKEQLIALLKERKQIVIQQAVTGKLKMENGEWKMRPIAEMKDSGVEWIGEIPEGWEVKKLKFVVKKHFSGGTPPTDKLEYWGGGIPWISSVDVKSDYLSNSAREISVEGLKQSSSNMAPKGSVVFVTRSGILQHTFALSILEIDMAINQDIKCIIFSGQIFVPYFLRLIQGNSSKILVETRQQAATVESINVSAFFNLSIPIPPLPEQSAIVAHIESQSANIDKAIGLQERQIEKLKELKASLIDGAVTGKIKVPDETSQS